LLGKEAAKVGWGFLWVIFLGLAVAAAGAYAVYKYRLRVNLPLSLILSNLFFLKKKKKIADICFSHCEQSYMDSEIRAIMAQYMPLENQGEAVNRVQHADI
jgi:hypothetical protein